MITIGVMSGTSLDGADAVIASFPEDEKAPMATLGRAYLPMPGELREELKALALGTTNEIERAGDASVALADLYAAVIEKALQEAGIGRDGSLRYRERESEASAEGRINTKNGGGYDQIFNIRRGGAAAGAVYHGKLVYRTGQGDCGIAG